MQLMWGTLFVRSQQDSVMSDLNCSKRDFLKGAALSALTAMAPMGSLQAREYDESLKLWEDIKN